MCGSFSFAELRLTIEVIGAHCKTQYDSRCIETQHDDCICEKFCLSYVSQVEVWEDYVVYANQSSHTV